MTDLPPDTETQPPAPATRVRYRIRFTKKGLLRWISHRDLIRLWERVMRRAGLPLSMTEGFTPKPRIAFPSALALGIVGLDEIVDVQLSERVSEADLLRRLREDDQPGLEILRVELIPEGRPKAQLARSEYVVDVPESADLAEARAAVERLKQEPTVTILRKEKPIRTDVASEIPTLDLTSTELRFSLVAREQASIRPEDVLDLLGLALWPRQGATITRTRVYLQEEIALDRGSSAVSQKLSTH